MTVSTTDYRIQYSGDGSTVAFATDFEFIASGDLVVILTDSDGVDTTQVITTNYTVTGAGVDAGGTVTMVTAPASGEVLTIYRDTAQTQGTDYTEYDTFPADAHEQALDKLTLIAQENNGKTDRALQFLPSEDRAAASKNSYLPSPETGKALGWDASGNATNLTLASASTNTDVDTIITTGDKGKALRANATEDGYIISADAGTMTGTDTLTISIGLDGYNSNQVYTFRAAATNTGATTLNVDSLGAKDVKLSDGSALIAGDIVSGKLYHFWYTGTFFILINPSGVNGVEDGSVDENKVSGGVATFYEGSNPDLTDYPVGTVLLAIDNTGVVRNAAADVYYVTATTGKQFQIGSGTAQLSGTWRARGWLNNGGGGSDPIQIVQRVS